MLGGDWLPWTDDAQICSLPVDVAPTPTAEVSDITNMDAVQEIPDNVTLRAKNRIDQLNATQATMKSIVKSAAKLLKDYQAGAPKDVFTFSEETVDAMVLLNKVRILSPRLVFQRPLTLSSGLPPTYSTRTVVRRRTRPKLWRASSRRMRPRSGGTLARSVSSKWRSWPRSARTLRERSRRRKEGERGPQ